MLKKMFLSLLLLTQTIAIPYLRVPTYVTFEDVTLKQVPTFNIDQFTGEWLQVSSNYFVQTTSEIDWKCITVNVNKTTTGVKISKSPYIHGVYYSPNKVITNYYITNNVLKNNKLPLIVKQLGPVVDGKYDYAMLAGSDNITFFVWARDYSRYSDYKNEIDGLTLLWNYTASYKAPRSSFDPICIDMVD
jgi:hypothetical protein